MPLLLNVPYSEKEEAKSLEPFGIQLSKGGTLPANGITKDFQNGFPTSLSLPSYVTIFTSASYLAASAM